MQDGQQAILVPGATKARTHSSKSHNLKVAETLRAMTEEVTIVRYRTWSGNAKVRDKRGLVFLCNPNDLSDVPEGIYSI